MFYKLSVVRRAEGMDYHLASLETKVRDACERFDQDTEKMQPIREA
jgi:hypothetical protein